MAPLINTVIIIHFNKTVLPIVEFQPGSPCRLSLFAPWPGRAPVAASGSGSTSQASPFLKGKIDRFANYIIMLLLQKRSAL